MIAQGLFRHAASAYAVLHCTPGGPDPLGICPGFRIDKIARVVNRKVLESLGIKSTKGFPAICDKCRSWFNMSTNDGQQCRSVPVVIETHLKPKVPCMDINDAKDPGPLNKPSTIIFSTANHGLIDFDNGTRTTHLAIIHPRIHPIHACLLADFIPVGDSIAR